MIDHRPVVGSLRAPAVRLRDVKIHALAVGDKIPSGTFKHFNSEGNMKELTTEQLFKGKDIRDGTMMLVLDPCIKVSLNSLSMCHQARR